ncbi:hypothetical protein OF83DRAFT_1171986 [Amylostereum chailletii]|nr:hypothetical protein OF83DRAFT_1171986 [Amylostereum chailletii]
MDSALFNPYTYSESDDDISIGGVPAGAIPPHNALLFSPPPPAEPSLGLLWDDAPSGPSHLTAPESIFIHPVAPHMPSAPLVTVPDVVLTTPLLTREYFNPYDTPVPISPFLPSDDQGPIQPIHTRPSPAFPSPGRCAYMVFSSVTRTGYGKYTTMEDDDSVLQGVEGVVLATEVSPTPEEERPSSLPQDPQEERTSLKRRLKRRWSRPKRNSEAEADTRRRSSVLETIARLWPKSLPSPARRSRPAPSRTNASPTEERNGAPPLSIGSHRSPSPRRPSEPLNQGESRPSTPPFPRPEDWTEFGNFARPCIANVWVDNIHLHPNVNTNRSPEEIIASLVSTDEDPTRHIYHPENWVVGTKRRPAPWPAPTPSRPLLRRPANTYTLNPNLLAYWPYGNSQFCWDVSTSPRFAKVNQQIGASIVDYMGIASDFGEPATFPLAPAVRIVRWADDGMHWWPWPWPIEVCNSEGVLVGDVLHAVYANLGELLSREEWAALGQRRREAVTRVWKRRIEGQLQDALARRRAGEHWESSGVDGARRFDLLLENRYFRGLDVAPDGEGWLVHFGPPP